MFTASLHQVFAVCFNMSRWKKMKETACKFVIVKPVFFLSAAS